MRKDILKFVGMFVGGVAVGYAAGYFTTKRSADKFYAELAAHEIQEVKEHYRLLRKENVDLEGATIEIDIEEKPDSVSTEELLDILNREGYMVDENDISRIMNEEIQSEDIKELEVTNVFRETQSSFDTDDEYEEMVANRDPDFPYVIHVTEYMANEPEYEKYTLTYFEGDDTLVDERSQIVPDIERMVGIESLTMFGKYSGDNNIVYVRNERNNVDMEIIRDHGEYVQKVLGVNDRDPIARMREDD